MEQGPGDGDPRTAAKVALTASQCRAARRLLGWDRAELARAAGVSPITLREFENGKAPLHQGIVQALHTAFVGGGIVFQEGEATLLAGPALNAQSARPPDHD